MNSSGLWMTLATLGRDIKTLDAMNSQESNASNGVRIGGETKKLWPFEDNRAKLSETSCENFASKSNFEDVSSKDEWLGSLSLGVKKAGTEIKAPAGHEIKWHHCRWPLRGHESTDTLIGNESNGAVAGDDSRGSHELHELEAKVSRGWDEPNAQNMGRMKSQPNAKGEMYILNDGIDMKAKIAAMARRLEELEMKKMQELQLPEYKQHVQVLPQASNLEQAMVNLSKVVGDFVGAQKSINAQLSQRIDSVESSLNKKMDGVQNDLSQKIDNLQYLISRFANLNPMQEKGNFPS
uniref:Uncharacterized protein n=1 Tax=Vitis vinifera TaxID=29760 RepID=A5AU87_VITVI|nr:hypothetical protein VITISV_042215 [Vitis vinifera]